MGALTARFKGRHIHRAQRRLALQEHAARGRGRRHSGRDFTAGHHRQQHCGNRDTGRVAGERPGGRAQSGVDPALRHGGRRDLSAAKKRSHARISPGDFSSARAQQHLRRRLPRAQRAHPCDPHLFSGAGFYIRADADHHDLGLRRRGANVRGDDVEFTAAAARARRQDRLAAGFFRQAGVSHRERPARRRNLRLGVFQRLHLRPDVSRRKQQYAAPSRRVLDDRARDGFLRAKRQHAARRRVSQIHHPLRAGTLPRGPGIFQSVHREDRARDPGARRPSRFRPHHVHRRGRASSRNPARAGNFPSSGATICKPSTSAFCPKKSSRNR